jgi:carboxypeptidase Taq
MTALEAYAKLETRFQRLGALGEAAGFLNWDLAVVMPPASGEARGHQLAALEVTRHELLLEPRVAEWLDEAEAANQGLDDWQRANLLEMRRLHRQASALDARLVEALAHARQRCEALWREARPRADFTLVQESLAELLALLREAAAAKAAVLGVTPYEALLADYESGFSAERIATLLGELERELPAVLNAVLERQRREEPALAPPGPFPAAAQESLGRRLMVLLGFDFTRGRLDRSLHPFSGGTPDDLRITTRYEEEDFSRALMGVLHETGHALYEAGLPARWRRQPVGEARGMALHESQSLLIEMQAGRSPAFLGFLAPLAAAAFARAGPAWTAGNFRRLFHRVAPGFIRVDADEVTYPLHVILRWRLEQALLSGELAVAELPGAWNDAMAALLGVRPPNDRLGCLQDIHWYDGVLGYFPTYTLGALAAAQFFTAAEAAQPAIPQALARGDFRPLLAWLRQQVHARASSAQSDEIVAAATGRPLGTQAFLAHLKSRYLGG